MRHGPADHRIIIIIIRSMGIMIHDASGRTHSESLTHWPAAGNRDVSHVTPSSEPPPAPLARCWASAGGPDKLSPATQYLNERLHPSCVHFGSLSLTRSLGL